MNHLARSLVILDPMNLHSSHGILPLHPMGNPLFQSISGKSRLVKYYSIWPDKWYIGGRYLGSIPPGFAVKLPNLGSKIVEFQRGNHLLFPIASMYGI